MISKIETHFPSGVLTNEQLSALFPDWPAEKIFEKTGIRSRHIAGRDETAADLALNAAEKLLSGIDRSQIDFLLLCTQTPDFVLPTTACILQHRLGLPTTIGALDFNLGCSGFVYGLALAQGIIRAGNASNVLLLTADTYSKLIHPDDKSTRTIFGDAATATLVSGSSANRLHSFAFGTDGSGAEQLIVRTGGSRHPVGSIPKAEITDDPGSVRTPDSLYMNGPEVFNFTLGAVPAVIERVLKSSQLSADQIDLFVFHQANAFMLESLRRKLRIPKEKFVLSMEECGNTVSSTIPIALQDALRTGRIKSPARLLLAGFGVGLSWAGCILEWNE
jgi:3-oxoacyl-[acyl-carrier-protein] synthase III